jgi:aryl-alcohol dehydrogenase-like predicted oxidoreductase
MYSYGHSEKIIGDYVVQNRLRRDGLVIATKFAGNLYGHARDPNGGGTSRKAILQACDQSLRRLRTDYIDLYWMHVWDPLTPIDETLRTLQSLVQAGKVRYLGFSDAPAWKVAQAQTIALSRHWTPLIALQIEYSLLERTVESEYIAMAQELGLGITPWSPLKGGLLSGKHLRSASADNALSREAGRASTLSDESRRIVEGVSTIAEEVGFSSAAVALAWARSRPGVASPIIGARTVAQLDANLKALDLKLTEEHTAILDQLSAPPPTFSARVSKTTVTSIQDGMSVNGSIAPKWEKAPRTAEDIY